MSIVNSPLINLSQLTKHYTTAGVITPILKGISLTIFSGELVAIRGASGSGKSTLMNIIGLLDKSDEGSYILKQRNVLDLTEDEQANLRNQHIGFVFQQFNLLPRFTAEQNIALPLIYRQLSPSMIKQQVEQALHQVGMSEYGLRRPMQLSGGQQQRIAIARALVGNPEVILADEPTGALDSVTGAEIMDLFLKLHQQGRTIIIVTHDEKVAKQCSRQIILVDGKIINEVN